MGKRSPDEGEKDGKEAYNKRQKIRHVASSAEGIKSSQQLRQLLAFDQDAGRARQGIQSFKAFLETLLEEQNENQLSILNEYVEIQTVRNGEDKNDICMDDVMKTWSFASQSNNESLLSAVPAVLALLLRILSSIPDFHPFGLRLIRTLLQKRQTELMARGLSTNKSKEFIISPVLRLLQHMISFDEGTLAKQVFRAREYTFKALNRNLGLSYSGEDTEERNKPSVRSNAIRLFLSCVKFLSGEEKKELLTERAITSVAFRDIGHDPPWLLAEFLDTMKLHVVKDPSVSKEVKSKFFNAVNLGRCIPLCEVSFPDYELPEGQKPVNELAFEFLTLACITPDIGILRSQKGFYPQKVDPDMSSTDDLMDDFIDLGLESPDLTSKFKENVPVYNSILSDFIQALRPWASTKQLDLLIKIFVAAPELIADYYFSKHSFIFDPKLTTAWTGYAAVIFSTIQLQLPAYFGRSGNQYGRIPPPASIVMQSILPAPVTQKALNRCLFNQDSTLVTFTAMRLLVVAFEKLQETLKRYRAASAPAWDQAASQLTTVFCQQCPSMTEVINAFKKTPDSEILQRQAASRLIVLFYETVPQVALEARFDVSTYLTDALERLEKATPANEETSAILTEVENLLQISNFSPGMRWFHKLEAMLYSPSLTMIRLVVKASAEIPQAKIKSILETIIEENDMMQSVTDVSGLDCLLFALKMQQEQERADVYLFLDNCLLRCSTTPVKFIDAADEYYEKLDDESGTRYPLSLLTVVVVDQWPFFVKSSDKAAIENVSTFLATFIAVLELAGEDKRILKLVVSDLITTTPTNAQKDKISNYRSLNDGISLPPRIVTQVKNGAQSKLSVDSAAKNAMASTLFDNPHTALDDHRALSRWRKKDVTDLVASGTLSSLIELLSNPTLSARKEALSAIQHLLVKLHETDTTIDYPPREQMCLILSELVSTANKHNIDKTTLPHTITAFVIAALDVLEDPLHVCYAKINEFLCAGPRWDIARIPMVKSILDIPPHSDGNRHAEINWLLGFLLSALRTPEELTLFFKKRVFERLLTLYEDGYLGKNAKIEILTILGAALGIEGGTSLLLKRFSFRGWVEVQMKIEGQDGEKNYAGKLGLGVALELLLEKVLVLNRSTKQEMEDWSGVKWVEESSVPEEIN